MAAATSRDPIRVAVVHSGELMRVALRTVLEAKGLAEVVLEEETPEPVELALRKQAFDLAIVELSRPVQPVLAALERMHREHPHVGLVVLGELTSGLVELVVKTGVKGMLDMKVKQSEVCKAVGTIGDGGIHNNSWMRDHLEGPGRGPARDAVKHKVKLTARQHQALRWIGHRDGLSYAVIGDKMHISERSVHDHRDALFRLFHVHSRAALIVAAKEGHYI